MKANNKRSYLIGLSVIALSAAQVTNYPGSDTIDVLGSWLDLNFSSGVWSEYPSNIGQGTQQTLSVTITDASLAMEKKLKSICSTYVLVKLHFSNGVQKVVGTDEFPVLLQMESTGAPSAFSLSLDRNSPEAAKLV